MKIEHSPYSHIRLTKYGAAALLTAAMLGSGIGLGLSATLTNTEMRRNVPRNYERYAVPGYPVFQPQEQQQVQQEAVNTSTRPVGYPRTPLNTNGPPDGLGRAYFHMSGARLRDRRYYTDEYAMRLLFYLNLDQGTFSQLYEQGGLYVADPEGLKHHQELPIIIVPSADIQMLFDRWFRHLSYQVLETFLSVEMLIIQRRKRQFMPHDVFTIRQLWLIQNPQAS